MKCTLHDFPRIRVFEYRSSVFDGSLYHLYINDVYEGTYMDEDSLMKRLALVMHTEVHASGEKVDFEKMIEQYAGEAGEKDVDI